MESRKGERNWTGKAENPTKGVKPIRDKDGKVIGWSVPSQDGKRKEKTLEWGKQEGLNPDDFPAPKSKEPVTGPTPESSDTGQKLIAAGGILLGIGAVACAIAEPCGAVVLTTLGIGGTTLALSQ